MVDMLTETRRPWCFLGARESNGRNVGGRSCALSKRASVWGERFEYYLGAVFWMKAEVESVLIPVRRDILDPEAAKLVALRFL